MATKAWVAKQKRREELVSRFADTRRANFDAVARTVGRLATIAGTAFKIVH